MIYLVEDDASISDLESYALKSAGFEVCAFADSDSFRRALQQNKPDLVILALRFCRPCAPTAPPRLCPCCWSPQKTVSWTL